MEVKKQEKLFLVTIALILNIPSPNETKTINT